jgi:ribosomal protein L1
VGELTTGEEVSTVENKIKFRKGTNGMIRVVVGDIEFEAHPNVVRYEASLQSIIDAERKFKEDE